jgi:peptide/nickel transport system substrate-binding protein
VSSDDVIYTYSKLQDADFPGPADLHAMWEQIELTKIDDRTVQFKLPEPFAPFLDYLSLGLLPDHLLRGVSSSGLVDHPINLQPIGTGPFRFVGFEVEDGAIRRVSLAAFEDYYGQPPYLERVDLHFFASQSEALQAYEAGDVQGVAAPTADTLRTLLADPETNIYSARLPSTGVVFLNTRHPEKTFLADKRSAGAVPGLEQAVDHRPRLRGPGGGSRRTGAARHLGILAVARRPALRPGTRRVAPGLRRMGGARRRG